MSGKRTFSKTLHPSRIGEIVECVELSHAAWTQIELITGTLTLAERESVLDTLDFARMMADDNTTPVRDIVATLSAIERMDDPAAIEDAWKTCDSASHAYLEGALYKMDGPDFFKVNPRPAKIKAAAWLARQGIPKQTAGRRQKSWPVELGIFVLKLLATKQLSTSISHGETVSPAVELLNLLMVAVDRQTPADDSAISKYLSKAKAIRQNSA